MSAVVLSPSSINSSIPSLASLPPEILHHILLCLDIPDLLNISRVSHSLRRLALDPYLHHRRLSTVPLYLTQHLPFRPPPHTLRPPQSSILLSRTHIVARAISRSLISIRLSRNLSLRPNPEILVDRHILPAECVGYVGRVAPGLWVKREEVRKRKLRNVLRGKLERRMSVESLVNANILPGELYGIDTEYLRVGSHKLMGQPRQSGQSPTNQENNKLGHSALARKDGERYSAPTYGYVAISPGLVEARRKVIKESLKDGLRAWIEKRALLVQKRAAENDWLEDIFDSDFLPRYTETRDQQQNTDQDHQKVRCQHPQQRHQPRVSVKLLVRRFTNSIIQHQNRQSSFNNIHNSHHSSPSPSSGSVGQRPQSECTCDKHISLRQRRRQSDDKAGTAKFTPSTSTSTPRTISVNTPGRKWERPPPPYSWGEYSYIAQQNSHPSNIGVDTGIQREVSGKSGGTSASTPRSHGFCGSGAGSSSGGFGLDSTSSSYNRYRRDSNFTLSVSVGGCREPTRGHVLGLRRFWEGVMRGNA